MLMPASESDLGRSQIVMPLRAPLASEDERGLPLISRVKIRADRGWSVRALT